MPSEAFIRAASAANRKPVVLLAIESAASKKAEVSTRTDFEASPYLRLINTELYSDRIVIASDDVDLVPRAEPYLTSGALSGKIPGDGTNWASTGVIFTRVNTVSFKVFLFTPVNCTTHGVRVYGRMNGGAWSVVAEVGYVKEYTNFSLDTGTLARGTWEFYLSASYKTYFGNDTIQIKSWTAGHETHFYANGTITTTDLDMGSVPTVPCRFEPEHLINTGTSITYTIDGRTDSFWTALGTFTGALGETVPAYRYYRVTATMYASSDGLRSPEIKSIKMVEGKYTYLSTHKDEPVLGALPYIMPSGISSISSKIDLTQQATVGELTAKLFWTQFTGDLVAGDAIKNQTLVCKLGFLGLAEADYEPYFVGTWYDYQSDAEKGIITVKTRNILKRFNKKVPTNEDAFSDYNATTKVWTANANKTVTLAGNVMAVMQQIIALLGIPNRLVNAASFTALETGARSGSTAPVGTTPGSVWYVKRVLTEPTDAMEMLNELSVSSGVFLFEGADGRLTAKLYDDFANSAPAYTLDAKHIKFRPLDGGQKDLYTRQVIYYGLKDAASGGSNATDYNFVHVDPNVAVELQWGEVNPREWKDKWNISVEAIRQLGARWKSWFSTPHALTRADDVPPRFHGIERGAVISVNNLQQPCAADDWGLPATDARFLVMGKSVSDPTTGSATVSFDLMQLALPDYDVPATFPEYSRLDYWPAVTALTTDTRYITNDGITSGAIDVSFEQPAGFTNGYATVWTRTNGGEWVAHTVVPFGLQETIRRLSIPAKPGDVVEVKVSTGRPNGTQQPLDQAPTVTETVPVPDPDPSGLLGFINPDISNDKLAQYLNKEISLVSLMETVNAAVADGALEDGSIGFLPDVVYSFSRDVVLQAGQIGEHSAIFELLKDKVTLQLNNYGRVAGLTMGWDDTNDTSEIVFLSDVFKICLPDGTGIKQAFTVADVGGVPTVGINGDLIVGGAITGVTIRTKADPGVGDRSRFEVSVESNYATFFDENNVAMVDIGSNASSLYSIRAYGRAGRNGALFIGSADSVTGVHGSGVYGEGRFGGYGGTFESYDGTGAGPGAIKLVPLVSNAAPTVASHVGALHCTSDGVLYIYTSTGWQKVGAQ